ncbi:MAG TPA: D-alanine--D-alanine ligase, partial [Polyangiaceae bacterium]
LPGMTETSLLPKIARAAGFGFAELCEAILERATLHTGTLRRNADEPSALHSRRGPGDASRLPRLRTA